MIERNRLAELREIVRTIIIKNRPEEALRSDDAQDIIDIIEAAIINPNDVEVTEAIEQCEFIRDRNMFFADAEDDIANQTDYYKVVKSMQTAIAALRQVRSEQPCDECFSTNKLEALFEKFPDAKHCPSCGRKVVE